MDLTKIFRWRSRVKTAAASVAGGSVETLASHVADINAHPDYLKKGSAVPTGQEAAAIARHEISKIGHAKNYLRRGEALRTVDQFNDAKDTDFVENANNYMTGTPQPHIVTAYVLNQLLASASDVMVKHNPGEAVGDGSQIIYVGSDGYVRLSTKNIGSNKIFVYLENGVIKACTLTMGGETTPVYLVNGEFKEGIECAKRNAPNLTRNSGKTEADVPTSPTPSKDDPNTMIATKKYVDDAAEGAKVKGTVGSTIKPIWLNDGTFQAISGPIGDERQPVYVNSNGEIKAANTQIPINGCYINTDGTDPAEQLGYGTWKQIAEIGSLGFIWSRVEPEPEPEP